MLEKFGTAVRNQALEESAKFEADAERYRWLRQNDNYWGHIELHHSAKYPECMDLAIDTLKGKQND